MKRFENNLSDKEAGKAISRREFLSILGVGGAITLCPDVQKAFAQDSQDAPTRYEKHGWFYSFEEMSDIYEREYRGERVLKNIVIKKDGKWVGFLNGSEFVVPSEFIEKTLLHFRHMLEQKTANFLFRLDAFHGHFFVMLPVGDKYKRLHGIEEAREFVLEENTGVLYHNSEHLKVNPNNPGEAKVYSKRNVIGWYDGRPLTVLPISTETKSTAAGTPKNSVELELTLRFAAYKDGQFKIIVDGKEIRLDISFDDKTYY